MTAKSEIKGRLVTRIRDQDAAEDCAIVLKSLGFDVSSTSARGVNFSGPQKLFESVFNAAIELDNEPRFLTEPDIPENLQKAVRAVYFPTQVLYFDK